MVLSGDVSYYLESDSLSEPDFTLFDFTQKPTDEKPKRYWLNGRHYVIGSPPKGVDAEGKKWTLCDAGMAGKASFWTLARTFSISPTDDDWEILPHNTGDKVSRMKHQGKIWGPENVEKAE